MACLAQSILGQVENKGVCEHQQCAQTYSDAHLGILWQKSQSGSVHLTGQDAEMV